jgi:hypothetical protein
MAFNVTPLSMQHGLELQVAAGRALQQWAPNVREPKDIVVALDRVLLFLRQNGGAAPQARQVASLAFLFGLQVIRTAQWRWMSVSEDESVNPAIVSPDGKSAVLVVDVATRWVMREVKVSPHELYLACVEGRHHDLFTSLD